MRDRNIDLIDLFEVLVFIVWYRRIYVLNFICLIVLWFIKNLLLNLCSCKMFLIECNFNLLMIKINWYI